MNRFYNGLLRQPFGLPRNDDKPRKSLFSTNKRKGVAIILLIFSIIAIFSMCGFVIDLGIILNSRFEFQKLVETTALTAVTEYGAYEDNANIIRYPAVANISTNVNNSAKKNFDAFVASNSFLLLSQDITPVITFGTTIQSRYSRAIMVEATAVVRTYFLNIIGIRSIKLQASAAAMHIPVYLKTGNVLNGVAAYRDTQLRDPAGGAATTQTINGVAYTTPAIVNVNTNLNNIYGMTEGTVLSLGPGGYITIKLPASLIDGKGFDLQIRAAGNAAGYFVFAGNDTDPSDPYIDAANPGGGIDWVNISCTGTPIGAPTNGNVGSYIQNVAGIGNQAKFYGSGYFDMGVVCTNDPGNYNANVKSAKYLKIIDDNVEDGFILRDPEADASMAAIPSIFPGQNSSFTPGVSIDAIAVEHHSKLISINDFTKDTDNDGLLDVFENSLKLNPCGPSEAAPACGAPPGSDDDREYWGFANTGINNIIIDNPTTALRIDYPSRQDNPPKMYISY